MSLFGYPGIGHLMVGARKLGLAIILAFTILSIGVVYEIWVMVSPIIALYRAGTLMDLVATEGIGGLPLPTWWRILVWLLASGIVWLGAALHSFQLAKTSRTDQPAQTEPPTRTG